MITLFSLSAFAQTFKSCPPFIVRVATRPSSIEIQNGCESDNNPYTKLTLTQKGASDSVEVSLDSRNYPEERTTIEDKTIEIVESGLSEEQTRFMRANVYSLMKDAI